MNIRIDPILIEQKSVLVQMLELYQYDFSEFSNDDINEYGYFGYGHIDDYWNEKGRHPFFIRVENLQDWFWCVPAVNITICRTLII